MFKIWDADGGGSLDVDEVSLPLISLGMSTDTGFVEKLIKALKSKKNKPAKKTAEKQKMSQSTVSMGEDAAAGEDDEDDLSFTLKDFVTIFESDRVGERITRKVQEVCRMKQELKVNEELSNNLKMQQI